MSENNDFIQLPPLRKDTPSDVVAFMWEYMKVPEDSREKVKNLLKDANENGVKLSHQAPTLYDVVPKEEIILSVSYLLIVQSIICYKNQKHFNQFTMSLLFYVILFYIIFLPLYFPLSEFVNTGGTI